MRKEKLPWPLFTIDFEASGLGEFTYPIEIGIAAWPSPDAAIETWSSLIKPPAAWRQHRIWSAKGEAVHGISREELEGGISPAEALKCANELIGEHTAYCDGGEHDLRWLLHLAHAANFSATFRLGDWPTFTAMLPAPQQSRMVRWLSAAPVVHRAGADAERLMNAGSLMAQLCPSSVNAEETEPPRPSQTGKAAIAGSAYLSS